MGVTQLWQILSPVQEHQTLASLKGLVLAVDLSIWICESDGVRNMQGVVTKPHLRNLFFRILHLTQLGVKLVFVIEGAAPELKWDTMAKRQQNRFPGRQGKQSASQKPPGKQNRKNFNAILKECCELLDILGIPYVQSKGEAEAMCAVLNSAGLVDGCLTDDGDAFLYGAQTVYRNFTMNAKDPHVECYRVDDIESQLGIDRNGLVALALLLGCDFVPKGVPGIGMANAVKLMECLRGKNVLERLQEWRKIHESQCVDPVEKMVRKKALNSSDFPQTEVIHEFLHPKDRCPSRLSPWKRPVPVKFQEFALHKLDWPVEYTLEKILPLVTLWDMQDVLQSKNPSNHQHLQPHRIVKTRIRQGVPCYEIEWHKPVTDRYYNGDYYVTIETQDMFSQCYPNLVRLFQGETTSKNKKKKAKKKKSKGKANESIEQNPIDTLSFNFGKLNLKTVTNRLQESLHELKPSFTEYEGGTLTTKVKQSSVSQPSHQVIQMSSENQSTSVGNAQPVLNGSVSETNEPSDIPLSDRIKLRLQKRERQNKNKAESVNSICKGMEDLSINKNHSLSKRKKKKRASQRINNNTGDNSVCSDRVNSLRNSTVGSPVSPFVCETKPSLRNIPLDNLRKMSSPSTGNTFCSPVSYMKQSIQDSSDAVFKDSPIQNTSISEDSNLQKRTLTNFKFFDTPSKEENHTTATKTPTMNGIQKPNTPSILKGEWQTEFIESYIHELSKDFSLSASKSLQNKQTGLGNSGGNVINQSNVNTSQSAMEATQEMNFKLQSSLLDSLCASLIQTLTPKGMNKEQYESLCESLKKLEQDGTDLTSLKDLPCNLDFSDLEELSSGLKLPNKPNGHVEKNQSKNNGNKTTGVQLKDSKSENINGLGKSARKRLRKKQKQNVKVETAIQQKNSYNGLNGINNNKSAVSEMGSQDSLNSQSQDVVNVSVVDLEYSGIKTRKCSSIGANNINSLNKPTDKTHVSQQVKHINLNADNHKNESKINGIMKEASSNDGNKKKKKNKKKKIKKTFSDMDLSADTSTMNEFQYKMCSEYLKKALEGSSKSQPTKIEKASPVIDLSVDETFLELEVLSGNLANTSSTNTTEAKRKLALKRKLSNKPKVEDTKPSINSVDQSVSNLASLASHDPPVLSMNAAMSQNSNHSSCTNHIDRSPHKVRTMCINHPNSHDIDNNHESTIEAVRPKRVCNQAMLHSPKRNKTPEKSHVESGSARRYNRDFLDAMEEVIARASPALLSPKSPVKTCTRMSELSPKAAVKERCKAKRSPPYCRMHAGLVPNEIGMPDTYERNIQSCKDLRSWSVIPKMISKEYLGCQAGITGSLMDHRLQCRYSTGDSELFESAAKMYCNMNENHVRNIGIEMEKIDCELKATNIQHVKDTVSAVDKLDEEIVDDTRENTVCNSDKNDDIDSEMTAFSNSDQKAIMIDSDLDKSDSEKVSRDNEVFMDESNVSTDLNPGNTSSKNELSDKSVEITGNESHCFGKPLTDTNIDNRILIDEKDNQIKNKEKSNNDSIDKYDDVVNAKENFDVSDSSEEIDNDYTSCTEEIVSESKHKDVSFIDVISVEPDVIVVDYCTENNISDETSPGMIDKNDTSSSIIVEQLLPPHLTNITANGTSVAEHEGSSDKENERVLNNSDSCSGCTQDIPTFDSSSMLSGSSKVDEGKSAEKVASPIPLLDRLKMKFKKSSARNVLQSFTNGR